MDLKDFFEAIYSKFVLRDIFGKMVPGLIFLSAILLALNKFNFEKITTMSSWAWFATFGIAWIAGFAVQAMAETGGLIRYWPPEMDSRPGCLKQRFEQRYLKSMIQETIDETMKYLRGKNLIKDAPTLADLKAMKTETILKEFKSLSKKESTGLIKKEERYKFWYGWHSEFQRVASERQREGLERFVVIKEACGNTFVALIFLLIAVLFHPCQVPKNHHPSWYLLAIIVFLAAVSLGRMHWRHVYRQYYWMDSVLCKYEPEWNTKDPP